MTRPLWQWSAAALAAGTRERHISSREVIEAHLERIAAVNPEVNAINVVLEEQALRSADEADRVIAASKEVGALHGVPITLKDNLDLAGTPNTHGIASLRNSIAVKDAPVVAHLKRAGAIPIGRTNLPDYGLRYHTDNALFGATVNPWDESRTPGGSSGGEAAAIATGMSPLGIGNDMGGSLRYPAQCCGITAMRPSLGRLSRIESTLFPEPPLFYEQIASVNGPMARHVEDLRLALEVMSQPDPSDPWWTPAPRLGSALPLPIKVAMAVDPLGDGVAPAVAEALNKAAAILAEAGYEVEEAALPSIDRSTAVTQAISDMEIQRYLPQMLPAMSPDGQVALQALVGDTVPDLEAYIGAIGERHRIAEAWSLFLHHYPLVLGPVSTLEPFAVGADLDKPFLERFIRSIALTEICNLVGLPGLAVPVEVTNGLPQAVQLVASRFHEDLCFDAAQIIEQRQGTFTPIEPRRVA